MLACYKVAVTGSLASGKSTVCSILEKLGAYVVNADAIVHQLLSPDSKLGQELIRLLGDDIIQDKNFDRTAIANKVFRDINLLHALEALLHPAVEKEIKQQYLQVREQGQVALFVAEVPLLFEAQAEDQYDQVVVVTSKEGQARKRFEEKTEYDQEEYTRRLKRMIPQDQKIQKAHHVIDNDGTLADLQQHVEELYPRLLKGPKS